MAAVQQTKTNSPETASLNSADLSALTQSSGSLYRLAAAAGANGCMQQFPGGCLFSTEPSQSENGFSGQGSAARSFRAGTAIIGSSIPREEPSRGGNAGSPVETTLVFAGGRVSLQYAPPPSTQLRESEAGDPAQRVLVLKRGSAGIEQAASVAA